MSAAIHSSAVAPTLTFQTRGHDGRLIGTKREGGCSLSSAAAVDIRMWSWVRGESDESDFHPDGGRSTLAREERARCKSTSTWQPSQRTQPISLDPSNTRGPACHYVCDDITGSVASQGQAYPLWWAHLFPTSSSRSIIIEPERCRRCVDFLLQLFRSCSPSFGNRPSDVGRR